MRGRIAAVADQCIVARSYAHVARIASVKMPMVVAHASTLPDAPRVLGFTVELCSTLYVSRSMADGLSLHHTRQVRHTPASSRQQDSDVHTSARHTRQ